MMCPQCRTETAGGSAACVSCGFSPSAADNPTVSLIHFSAATRLRPGDELGSRYRILGMLGEGGMGCVYKAEDRELGRTVALKLLRPEMAGDASALQRLKQELLLASRVSHPNILRIHDLGDAAGLKFISMAFVDGEDLGDLLKREGRLPLKRALAVARQICAALDAAHAAHVVHRDLKPSNVLLDAAGQAYISDFGLAMSVGPEAARVTTGGGAIGTPRYMSPEQVEDQPVDHRSDLYSFGIILFEMVTGSPPFAGRSAVDAMYERVHKRPRDPRDFNPDLPPGVVQVIERCLQRDPERRYQNAHEVLRDLTAPESWGKPAIVRLRRKTIAVIASVLLLLLLAGILLRTRLPYSMAFGVRLQPAVKGVYLAVVPFQALGADDALRYSAAGIADALSARLFQLRDVHLASPSAVDRVKNQSPEKIAHALGVKLIVSGIVQPGPGADNVTAIAKLEDVGDKRLVWTERFSASSHDLLTLEDQIYARLIIALDLSLNNVDMIRGSAHPTGNMEAYDLYLRGRGILREKRDQASVKGAIDYFNKAISKDDRFALPYAGLADASMYMFDLTQDTFWPEKALQAAAEAERRNPDLPEAHIVMGSAYRVTGKFNEAILQFQRALQLAPNSDEANRRLASAYNGAGRKTEAIEYYRKAIDANPYYWMNHNQLGAAYLSFGDYSRALECFRKVTEIAADLPTGYLNMGVIYFHEGEYEKAISQFQKALRIQPGSRAYSNLSESYGMLGRYTEAVDSAEKAVAMNAKDDHAVATLADAYRSSGQREKAVATFDRAITLAYALLRINPRDAGTLGRLALYYAKKGEKARALEYIQRARDLDAEDLELIFDQSTIEAIVGDEQSALRDLRTVVQKGYSIRQIESEPDLKQLRSTPGYRDLIRASHGATR